MEMKRAIATAALISVFALAAGPVAVAEDGEGVDVLSLKHMAYYVCMMKCVKACEPTNGRQIPDQVAECGMGCRSFLD